MPMPFSRQQNDDPCATMFFYLLMLASGGLGLVIALAGMQDSNNSFRAAVALVSSGLIIVSFLQISKAWISLRTWLKIFSLIFLLGGLRAAYISFSDGGFNPTFYVSLVMGLLGILGLIFPRRSTSE